MQTPVDHHDQPDRSAVAAALADAAERATPHAADAASALVEAALSIVCRDLGPAVAAETVTDAVNEAATTWRKRHAH